MLLFNVTRLHALEAGRSTASDVFLDMVELVGRGRVHGALGVQPVTPIGYLLRIDAWAAIWCCELANCALHLPRAADCHVRCCLVVSAGSRVSHEGRCCAVAVVPAAVATRLTGSITAEEPLLQVCQ